MGWIKAGKTGWKKKVEIKRTSEGENILDSRNMQAHSYYTGDRGGGGERHMNIPPSQFFALGIKVLLQKAITCPVNKNRRKSPEFST